MTKAEIKVWIENNQWEHNWDNVKMCKMLIDEQVKKALEGELDWILGLAGTIDLGDYHDHLKEVINELKTKIL